MATVFCTKCGNPMIVRSRKSDGKKFLGCSAYPNCNNIMPFEATTVANTEIVKKEEKKVFKPSPYQQAIFDWVRGDGNSLVVEASA